MNGAALEEEGGAAARTHSELEELADPGISPQRAFSPRRPRQEILDLGAPLDLGGIRRESLAIGFESVGAEELWPLAREE